MCWWSGPPGFRPRTNRRRRDEGTVQIGDGAVPAAPRSCIGQRCGFGLPIDRWFRHELKELAYDTLLSPDAAARAIFRPGYVRHLLDEHCGRRRDHHTRLWALLMLELWFRMWIDAPTET